MPTTATDLRYGRRGGGWIPRGANREAVSVPCDVCGRPSYFATRHLECHPPVAAELATLTGQLVLDVD